MAATRSRSPSLPDIGSPTSKKARHWPTYVQPTTKPVRSANWRDALRHPDPSLVFGGDDEAVLIYDGYPKARHHLLGLAKKSSSLSEVRSVRDLRPVHLPALVRFHRTISSAARSLGVECRVGYHAQPSMNWLHCHIISTDFDSPCLKTKHHWHSFTTEFLVEPGVVENLLRDESPGLEAELDKRIDAVKGAPIRCWKCRQEFRNMPTLKRHLTSHLFSPTGTEETQKKITTTMVKDQL